MAYSFIEQEEDLDLNSADIFWKTKAVIATCRYPDRAVDLLALAEQHPGRKTVLKLDVNRKEDIGGAADRVKESFGRLNQIQIVSSSAMLHLSGKGGVNNLPFQGIISTLPTNTMGPLIMAKYSFRKVEVVSVSSLQRGQNSTLAILSTSQPKWDPSRKMVVLLSHGHIVCCLQTSLFHAGLGG